MENKEQNNTSKTRKSRHSFRDSTILEIMERRDSGEKLHALLAEYDMSQTCFYSRSKLISVRGADDGRGSKWTDESIRDIHRECLMRGGGVKNLFDICTERGYRYYGVRARMRIIGLSVQGMERRAIGSNDFKSGKFHSCDTCRKRSWCPRERDPGPCRMYALDIVARLAAIETRRIRREEMESINGIDNVLNSEHGKRKHKE
ncbi:MAG: hypothetical protein ACI30I_04255 [Parabacteroides sp.]